MDSENTSDSDTRANKIRMKRVSQSLPDLLAMESLKKQQQHLKAKRVSDGKTKECGCLGAVSEAHQAGQVCPAKAPWM